MRTIARAAHSLNIMGKECPGMPAWLKQNHKSYPVRSLDKANNDFKTHEQKHPTTGGPEDWPLQAPADGKDPANGMKYVGFRYQAQSATPWNENDGEHGTMGEEEMKKVSQLATKGSYGGENANKMREEIERLEKEHEANVVKHHNESANGGHMSAATVFQHIQKVQKLVDTFRERASVRWCKENKMGGGDAHVKYAYGMLFFLFFIFAASFAYDIATNALAGTVEANDASRTYRKTSATPFSMRQFGLGVPMALLAFCLTVCVLFMLKLAPGGKGRDTKVFTSSWLRLFAYAVAFLALVGASFDYCEDSLDEDGENTDCANALMWTRGFTAIGFYAAALLTVHEVTMGANRVPGALIAPAKTPDPHPAKTPDP